MKDTAAFEHLEVGAPVLTGAGSLHGAAQRVGHRLKSVADAQYRQPGAEQRRVNAGRPWLVHAGRAPGQHDRRGFTAQDLRSMCLVPDHLGIHLGLADPAGDQLRILRAEVDDQHERTGWGHSASVGNCGRQ